jgi:hypothetical protein
MLRLECRRNQSIVDKSQFSLVQGSGGFFHPARLSRRALNDFGRETAGNGDCDCVAPILRSIEIGTVYYSPGPDRPSPGFCRSFWCWHDHRVCRLKYPPPATLKSVGFASSGCLVHIPISCEWGTTNPMQFGFRQTKRRIGAIGKRREKSSSAPRWYVFRGPIRNNAGFPYCVNKAF